MSEAYQYDDGCRLLLFRHPDAECRALSAFYDGIRFNQVRLTFLPARALEDAPEREEIDITFNISGAQADLARHGFAHPSWWRSLPPCGITHRCHTDGFGRAWRGFRTHRGFRLQGAQYPDSMSKLTLGLREVQEARGLFRVPVPARRPERSQS